MIWKTPSRSISFAALLVTAEVSSFVAPLATKSRTASFGFFSAASSTHSSSSAVSGGRTNFGSCAPRAPSAAASRAGGRADGQRDRGARRIVAGGNPPEVFYYTADHYSSFRQIEPLP